MALPPALQQNTLRIELDNASIALRLRPDAWTSFFQLAWRFIYDLRLQGLDLPALQQCVHPHVQWTSRALTIITGHFLTRWGPLIWPDQHRAHLRVGSEASGGIFYSRDGIALQGGVQEWVNEYPSVQMAAVPVHEVAAFSTLGKLLTQYFKCILHLSVSGDITHLQAPYWNEHVAFNAVINARAP